MPNETETRNREFRAALALAGMTGQQYAERVGVSWGHLWGVVRGERESKVLETEIDKFIDKHLISKYATAA